MASGVWSGEELCVAWSWCRGVVVRVYCTVLLVVRWSGGEAAAGWLCLLSICDCTDTPLLSPSALLSPRLLTLATDSLPAPPLYTVSDHFHCSTPCPLVVFVSE